MRVPDWAPVLTDTATPSALVLRGHRPEDVDAVLDQCRDPEFERWTGIPWPYRRSHAEEFVRTREGGVLRVPRERIVDATVTKVSPLGDYGGWGLRGGFDGSWGWVTAEGEALRIRRHGMRDLVFTVDAAAEAARTVNALISKAVG